ncbi:unnamed protein product [Didymodactylos carnosus]|uniref:Uncharacterized protein n=1 Tax=Didymodactylos carnosus TaxID=1234261 RepID=A0A8S2NJS5_9BILA|nr:unnamed protein product [Didymodactylos carnosus]CAF4004140.1 unnamed protein product [Didymodactylos carnosus]
MTKDLELAQKMNELRDRTNELGNFVAKLKEKSEKPVAMEQLDAFGALSDFPLLSMEQLNDLTFGIFQLKQAKSYTIEHLSADGQYVVKVGKQRPDLIKAKIQSRHKNLTEFFEDTS